MRLMWVAEQRLVIKALGRGHLMTRQKQRSLRRSGVKGRRKDWGGVCQTQSRSLEKGVFRKAGAAQGPSMPSWICQLRS